MTRVLFVCTGNTCRSPMAEVLLRRELVARGAADQIEVGSAGTHVRGSGIAAAHAQTVVGDLDAHRARSLEAALSVGAPDLILTMTRRHLEAVPTGLEASTLGDYAGTNEDVPDPYGGDEARYRQCSEALERLVASAADRLLQPPG